MDEPPWIEKNNALRRKLGLPEYKPPRFIDGNPTHAIVKHIENKYGCSIYFVGVNTKYPQDWEIWVENKCIMELERRRDSNGNVIYNISQEEFRQCVEGNIPTDLVHNS